MRKSKSESAETRKRIVSAASAEFRRNGVDGTGLADLMSAAGLTHGGFYKHFESKDQVVEEALAAASESMAEELKAALSRAPGSRGLNAALAEYLSPEHRDAPADGCPLAAMASELARSSNEVRERATAGFLDMVDALAARMEGLSPAAAKKKAMFMVCAMIGAMTVARVVNDPELSASILRQTYKNLTKAA
ncbi:TetR/AcrR family transcriptional regulator [Hyphomicrobium sp.]|uniref:TetR/AcrR family transcriptional regulator n=1 Tax=Hyphomicrobium sp. TaxID=82 RepID=UPI002D76AE12|nr:TetR/AcrR family transcriptional regulator [Hyphomicrobium sp.]HET6389384.1 TetR/AcrR family transcriptional regulator [Hyphomicrobium sp.]